MAREVSTNGRKKIETLMKEFNANFPYLNLTIGSMGEDSKFRSCDRTKTLSEIRLKKGSGEVSFSGRKKVETIEKEFHNNFGLTVQICYTTKDGKGYYTAESDNKKTLTELNREKEARGCQKDIWY